MAVRVTHKFGFMDYLQDPLLEWMWRHYLVALFTYENNDSYVVDYKGLSFPLVKMAAKLSAQRIVK